MVWKWYICLGTPTVQLEKMYLCLQAELIVGSTSLCSSFDNIPKALYHQAGTFCSQDITKTVKRTAMLIAWFMAPNALSWILGFGPWWLQSFSFLFKDKVSLNCPGWYGTHLTILLPQPSDKLKYRPELAYLWYSDSPNHYFTGVWISHFKTWKKRLSLRCFQSLSSKMFCVFWGRNSGL